MHPWRLDAGGRPPGVARRAGDARGRPPGLIQIQTEECFSVLMVQFLANMGQGLLSYGHFVKMASSSI